MKDLSTVEQSKESRRCRGHVIRSGIERLAKRATLNMIYAGVLVACYSGAQATALDGVAYVHEQSKIVAFNPPSIGSQVTEFTAQTGPGWVGNVVEFLPASQLNSVPIIQVRAEEPAKDEAGKREAPRVGMDEHVDFVDHYDGLLLLAFNFFGGIFIALLFGFIQHARRYGINNAWRDLVFDWPIPYWMRFVPKAERDL